MRPSKIAFHCVAVATAMSRTASTVIPAVCGVATTLSRLQQRVVRPRRLFVEHVQTCAGDTAVDKRVEQRRFVVDRSARGGDEKRGGLHRGELVLTDEALGLGGQRASYLDEVDSFDEFGQADALDAAGSGGRLVHVGVEDESLPFRTAHIIPPS